MMISKRNSPLRLGSCFIPMSSIDQQVRLEILGQHLVLAAERFVLQEVANHVEDRAVVDQEARLDRLVAHGLDQERLADARGPEPEHVLGFADEAAGGQVVDLLLVDRRIEREVELVQGLQFAEGRGLDAAVDLPVAADGQFVLEDQLQELGMRQRLAAASSSRTSKDSARPERRSLRKALCNRSFISRVLS